MGAVRASDFGEHAGAASGVFQAGVEARAAAHTNTMAAVETFLLPVVIDNTRDSEAHGPEEF